MCLIKDIKELVKPLQGVYLTIGQKDIGEILKFDDIQHIELKEDKFNQKAFIGLDFKPPEPLLDLTLTVRLTSGRVSWEEQVNLKDLVNENNKCLFTVPAFYSNVPLTNVSEIEKFFGRHFIYEYLDKLFHSDHSPLPIFSAKTIHVEVKTFEKTQTS